MITTTINNKGIEHIKSETEEVWVKDYKYYRENNLPQMIKYFNNIKEEYFFKNGTTILNKMVAYDENKNLRYEYINRNDDKPNRISYINDGKIYQEEWVIWVPNSSNDYKGIFLHYDRSNGKSNTIYYWSNGKPSLESWISKSRGKEPITIVYNEDGTIKNKIYNFNDFYQITENF